MSKCNVAHKQQCQVNLSLILFYSLRASVVYFSILRACCSSKFLFKLYKSRRILSQTEDDPTDKQSPQLWLGGLV